MTGLSKRQALADLRARIEGIEKRPLLADAASAPQGSSQSVFALPQGMLHEVFTDAHRNGGAVLGFAMAAARGFLTSERPAILYLQLQHETAETGFPYGVGLIGFGIDPGAVIFIRAASIVELLWAAEEALACKAVATVIADIGSDPKALDFTATRRLNMKAAETKGAFLLLRYGLGRTASAARLRWHVKPEPSGIMPFDPRAPGQSRWLVRLEKGLWHGEPNKEWLLGWTKNGFDIVDTPDANRAPAATPVPRALPAAVGDRLSQTA
jgi:protein ImuA